MRIADRHLGEVGFGCDRRDRADAGGDRRVCSTNWWIWRPISNPFWGLLIDPALGLKGRPTLPFLARFLLLLTRMQLSTPISIEKARHETCRCPRIEDRPCPVRFHRQGGGPQDRDFARCVLGRRRRHRQKAGAEKPRAARLPRRPANQDRRLAPRQQGQGVRHERLHDVSQGDRLSAARAGDAEGRDRQRRRGDRQDLRAAARGAAHQRPLRAERGECTLGQLV